MHLVSLALMTLLFAYSATLNAELVLPGGFAPEEEMEDTTEDEDEAPVVAANAGQMGACILWGGITCNGKTSDAGFNGDESECVDGTFYPGTTVADFGLTVPVGNGCAPGGSTGPSPVTQPTSMPQFNPFVNLQPNQPYLARLSRAPDMFGD